MQSPQLDRFRSLIDTEKNLQTRLTDLSRAQTKRSKGCFALAGAALLTTVAAGLALPAALFPLCVVGGAAVLGASMFGLRARSVASEAVERREMLQGGIDTMSAMVDQINQAEDDAQRQLITTQVEILAAGMSARHGGVQEGAGFVDFGGNRLRRRR